MKICLMKMSKNIIEYDIFHFIMFSEHKSNSAMQAFIALRIPGMPFNFHEYEWPEVM